MKTNTVLPTINMKAIVFRILLLLFFPLISFSQNYNGVYFEFLGKECPFKEVKLLNVEEFVCISEKPIIDVRDYDKISKLEIDTKSNLRRFEITLTERGTKKLLAISKFYSGKNLAFVVDDEAICLMKVRRVMASGKIIVNEYVSNSSLEKPYQNIKASIELKSKVK